MLGDALRKALNVTELISNDFLGELPDREPVQSVLYGPGASAERPVLWLKCCRTSACVQLVVRCGVENSLELPQMDVVHASEDSVTVVDLTDN